MKKKIDILAVGVHPDDVELSCSGTLLRHIAKGKTVGLLDLSRGELGTRGTPEIRDAEAVEAAKIMGAKFRINLGMADGFFEYSRPNLLKIVGVIREYQPEIVLANALDDRHPDHGRAAKLTADACYYSGLIKIETRDEAGNLHDRWRPKAVYHYIQDRNLKPDFVVDITAFLKTKMRLITTFRSQFYIPGEQEREKVLETPISGADFLEFLKAKARSFGRVAGFKYAEGFNAARTPGLKNLFDLR